MNGLFLISFAAVCFAFIPTQTQKISYKGFKLLRFHATTEETLKTLDDLAGDESLGLDFWTEPILNNTVDVCVPPAALDKVLTFVNSKGIEYTTSIDDIQSLIDQEEENIEHWRTHRRLRRANSDAGSGIEDAVFPPGMLDPELFYWFNVVGQYASTEEIHEWMRSAKQVTPALVKLEIIGHSFEKRPLLLAKIGVPRKDGKPKPIIWLDSGIHAREWVTVAALTYMIYQFVDGYGKKPEITKLLRKYDWYLLPIHNPDGYEYSRNHNRMWRKNRAPTFNEKCTGVDLNRNYNFMWLKCKDNPKAKYCMDSEKPCSAVYGGSRPFSEPESTAVSKYILKNKSRIKMFFTLHSYSQLWLLPWGYTKVLPKDVKELERVAHAGCAALEETYGTQYVVGSPARILYHVGGSSLDWAKAKAQIKYSYTLELRDKGQYGFLLPQSLIVPTANETFRGLLNAIRAMNARTFRTLKN